MQPLGGKTPLTPVRTLLYSAAAQRELEVVSEVLRGKEMTLNYDEEQGIQS